MLLLNSLVAAGLGGVIGSLLTTFVQGWLAQRSAQNVRNFQEKREAYVGILEAIHNADINETREAALTAGYWYNRCQLVASKDVLRAMSMLFETNPLPSGEVHPKRREALEKIHAAMRRDLRVAE
jgi:hypothetical protein